MENTTQLATNLLNLMREMKPNLTQSQIDQAQSYHTACEALASSPIFMIFPITPVPREPVKLIVQEQERAFAEFRDKAFERYSSLLYVDKKMLNGLMAAAYFDFHFEKGCRGMSTVEFIEDNISRLLVGNLN